jgi:hypothetical protein
LDFLSTANQEDSGDGYDEDDRSGDDIFHAFMLSNQLGRGKVAGRREKEKARQLVAGRSPDVRPRMRETRSGRA